MLSQARYIPAEATDDQLLLVPLPRLRQRARRQTGVGTGRWGGIADEIEEVSSEGE
jgi:hypothetical protein